jgi:NAD+ synthase
MAKRPGRSSSRRSRRAATLTTADLVARGFNQYEVNTVCNRLERTHWKRKLPTVAMLTHTAIGESYLRPVDY